MANADLKSLFTSEDEYTVLELLNVLIDEVGKSMVKTAKISQDVDDGLLTLTITLSDDSVVSSATNLNSLTDNEKETISQLAGSFTKENDTLIWTNINNFQGDMSVEGDFIATGKSTFTELHADTLTSTDGQDLLSYDGTNTSLKGKGTRPLYNDGEMALLSDIGGVSMSAFLSSIGKRRYAGKAYCFQTWDSYSIDDGLAKYLTDFSYCWYGASFVNPADNSLYTSDITFNPDYFGSGDYPMSWAFAHSQNECAIILPSVSVSNAYSMFAYSNFTKILVSDGASVKLKWSVIGPFMNCPNLTEIGAFDLSNALTLEGAFAYSPKLKSIHCTHYKASFYIASSTAFEEADLVEILNNLDTVSSTQTLTMGSTNLAKLTSDEILIATGKGWALN